MRIAEIGALALDRATADLRRRVLGGVVSAILLIGAVYEFSSAAFLLLNPYVGPVGARLILASAYAVAAMITMLVVRSGRAHRPACAQDELPSARTLQLVTIAEAIMLGYSLSRRTAADRER